MSKELTNLQDLKSAFVSHCKTLGCEDNYIKVCKNKFDTIETALKDYEKKTKLAKEYNDVNNVAKRLKALEIIKEKPETFYLINSNDYETYFELANDMVIIEKVYTKEEFDLLKEVLK